MKTRRPLLLLLVLVVIAAWAHAASAHEDHRPALRFEQTELKTTLDELEKGVQLDVHNDRARPLTARLRISDMKLKSPGSPARDVPTAKVVKFQADLDVAAAGTRQLELKAEGAQLVNGVYRGQLSMFEPETDSVVRIPVTLSVGQPELVSPTPAVEKLTIRVVRKVPWGDDSVDVRDPYLPLAVPGGTSGDKLDLTKEKPLGLLPGDQRRVVEVTFDGKTRRLSSNVSAAELGILNAGRPGEYKGKIDTLPDAAGGDVEITVVTTDTIWIALVPLLFGIALALWSRHWKGAGREAVLLGHEEAKLGPAYTDARKEFQEAAAGKAWVDYDTQADFHAKAGQLRGKIQQLAAFDEVDADKKKAIEEQLDALEGHVAALPGLADDLAALDDALDRVERLGPVDRLHDPSSPPRPVFATTARQLFQGRTLTISEFDTLREEVAEATSLALRWEGIRAQAARAAGRVARFDGKPLDPENEKLVRAADQSLHGAWVALWEAESAKAVRERKLVEGLVEAFGAVGRLTAISLPEERATLGGAAPDAGDGAEDFGAAGFDSLLPPLAGSTLARADSDPKERVDRLATAIKRGDRWQLMIAGSVALFTGLQALYIDKVFGDTPLDYLTALLWGITTAGAVDLLAEALRSRLSGVLPGR